LIGARNERGAKDSGHVLSLVLLNPAGGTAADGLNFLREKLAFEQFGIRIPSPGAGREWLKSFNNPSEDSERGMGHAFIPEENKYPRGWRDVFAKSFHFAWKPNPRRFLTFDMDDTEIETGSSGALRNYKGNRGFWAFITYCAEPGQIVSTRYCDGNVPPGWRQLEEFRHVLGTVPDDVEEVALRSAGAGYQAELFRFCNENPGKRFRRISYGVFAEINDEFGAAAKRVSGKEWKPLKTYEDGNGKSVVLQEWAEIAYAPNSISTKKHGPDYRFFAVREKRDGSGKDTEKEDAPKKLVTGREDHGEQLCLEGAVETLEAKSDKVRKLHLTQFGGSICKLFGVASSIEDGADGKPFGLAAGGKMDGRAIIEWQRKRCGKSEEVHHILKEELAGGHVPSKYFGANAAWFNASALAFNLHTILKLFFLPEEYRKSRPRTLRFLLYAMAGKIVNHGRRIVLKLWEGDYGGKLPAGALAKLEMLP